MKLLIRRHKITVTLSMVLLSWIPHMVTQHWDYKELIVEYQASVMYCMITITKSSFEGSRN